MNHLYTPHPLDTSHIILPEDLLELMEDISRHVHEIWAKHRIEEGWEYGKLRNDKLKQTPCLVPYEQLPEIEKNYDRETVIATIEYILSQGYKICKT